MINIQSPVWSFVTVDVFKVLVLFGAVDVDEFKHAISLLHFLERLLFTPSMLRISQVINSYRTRIEREYPT
jgi:hypothetical protein